VPEIVVEQRKKSVRRVVPALVFVQAAVILYFSDRMRLHSWVWPETVALRNGRENSSFGARILAGPSHSMRHDRVDLFDKLTLMCNTTHQGLSVTLSAS
jgi:hypothetical protein